MTVHVGLPRLLEAYRERTGASYQDMATTTGLHRSVVHLLATQDPPHYTSPRALAALGRLGIPQPILCAAAIVTAGYGTTEPDLAALDPLVLQVSRLTPDQRHLVQAMLDVMLA
jgi:hypothetical protein